MRRCWLEILLFNLLIAGVLFVAPRAWFESAIRLAASANLQSDPSPYVVAGRVEDYSFGSAVPEVTLTFTRVEGNGNLPGPVKSDAAGYWRQSGFEAGTQYRMTPSLPDYAFIPPSADFRRFLEAPASLRALKITPFDFFGRVTDINGRGIAEVRLSVLLGNNLLFELKTDAAGNFRRNGLAVFAQPAQFYSLTASKEGWLPTGFMPIFLRSDKPINLIFSREDLAVVSAANFRAPVANDSLVTIFGAELATETAHAATLPLPLKLGGVSVQRLSAFSPLNEPGEALPLLFVSPTQINCYIPMMYGDFPQWIVVRRADGQAASRLVAFQFSPGLFAANGNGRGVAAAVVLRVRADGSQSFEPVALFDPVANRYVARPIDLGPEAGSASERVFLLLFGTGWRALSSFNPPVARIGGQEAPVNFAGPQGSLGLDQFNLQLPRSLSGRGEVEVVLSNGNRTANTVTVNLK